MKIMKRIYDNKNIQRSKNEIRDIEWNKTEDINNKSVNQNYNN